LRWNEEGTAIHSPQASQPRPRQYTARYQARLDAATLSKLEDLAKTFHRKRAPILRYVMWWGLGQSKGWMIDASHPAAVRTVSLLLEPDLLRQVQETAAARGVSVAAWVREAVRRLTQADVPDSWRTEVIGGRSHDSPTYGQRFMLRLDKLTAQKLEALVAQFGQSRAEIIRQLVAQAKPEDFPQSWQLAARERERRRTRP
jgi:predicted DNA-binding protein